MLFSVSSFNRDKYRELCTLSCLFLLARLLGAENIKLSDFSGLSSRMSVFSSSDDYLGFGMTNPTVLDQFTYVKSSPVYLGKYVVVGANSLVAGQLDSWIIYAGTPCVKKARRAKKMFNKEMQLKAMFKHINFE